jgi:diadenylate cyclase
MHNYIGFIPPLRWQDALDILIVAFVIYRVMVLIRGTRTVQMVLGLVLIGMAFVASQMLGLFTLNWLLNNFLGSLIVILVVIFQSDIRRALARMGTGPFFTTRINVARAAEELTAAATWLAARRIGALIVIEQEMGLSEYVETGREIDAQLSRELLETIFMRGSPLHDGAVIVKGDRVVAAACLLPLATDPNVALTLGTRHRAAIGLTEENDAVVIVVSEERGTISVANRGRLLQEIDSSRLLTRLHRLRS